MKIQAITNKQRKLDLNWDVIDTYLSRWKPGTPIDIEFVRRQSKKSHPLRKFYFAAVLPPFMQHLGYDPDEEVLFHRQLKIVYFRIKPDKRGIYRNKDIPSVFGDDSNLAVPIKRQFVDWVMRKAAMEGVYIESPA